MPWDSDADGEGAVNETYVYSFCRDALLITDIIISPSKVSGQVNEKVDSGCWSEDE